MATRRKLRKMKLGAVLLPARATRWLRPGYRVVVWPGTDFVVVLRYTTSTRTGPLQWTVRLPTEGRD